MKYRETSMAIIKSFSPFQNLSNFQTFLVDENPLSDYFRITELKETFTGGKNGFLIEGSEFLKETTEVKIELLDVEGNPIYFEPGNGIPEYYEGTSKLISVHIYDDTPIGLGKITILGELKNWINDEDDGTRTVPIPQEWEGVYNVKWEKNFKVNKNLPNEDVVRFYKRPQVSVDELVKPIFTKSVNQVTDTGTVNGIPQLPNEGTDLTNYRAGTSYKLVRNDGLWDIDVDENIIDVTVNGKLYSPKIVEVLNDTELLVDIPFTNDNNIVESFSSQPYSITYTDFQNETVGESALTGSFAKIDITQLKTFVGDVARVKVFRKSRSSANDFQFVQESRLESTELLRDITTTENTELSYGRFDQSNLSNYWLTSSNDHPTEVDSSVLSQAVKVDYNGSGIQQLITSQSFSISKDVEYTLNFRTLLSGSISDDKYLKAYFSGSYENGSPFTQSFTDITPDGSYVVRKNITENVIAQEDVDAKLVFEFKGDDWYISNVSLRNAQDTSFSPDEFTLIQDIPRKLVSETFDFRFEFYDINNNYIPVNVVANKTFDGGNDFNTTTKLLTFESDRNAFRYISGSGNPESQQIQFKTTIQNLTGSIAYFSSAFDEDGIYIEPTDWISYPGGLTNPSNNGGLVTISSFEGTWGGVEPKPEVFSIIYTASIEELEEFETVYRLEDGENAPTLLVTSNTNQFIYEPTTLSPKPSNQNITIRAQRKNLASIDTPITINSSSDAPLTFVDTTTGIDTYTISVLDFSASFAQNNFDEVTYEFTGSDVFGVEQSDEITLSKVINFDGASVVLSNESTSFPAKSTGEVLGGFASSVGNVQMNIGNTKILHDDISGGRNKNTFDIVSIQETNVTALSTSPTTSEYGISGFPTQYDSGSLVLNIEYLAGDNSTTQTFQKIVSYTKSKNAVPNVEVSVNLQSQTINSNSVGSGSESPRTIQVNATEGGTNRFDSIGELTYSGGIRGTVSGNTILFTDTVSDMVDDIETITIPVNFTDSEGTNGQKEIDVIISRIRASSPIISITATPQFQNVNSDYDFNTFTSPIDVSVDITEGTESYQYIFSSQTLTENTFQINNVTNGEDNNDGTITPNTPNNSSPINGEITISYKNSEGTEFIDEVIPFGVSVVLGGTPAKTVNLTLSDNSVIYNADGLNPSPSEITLTATTSNFRNAKFKFTGGGEYFDDETEFKDDNTATFTVPTTFIDTPLSFRVGASEASEPSTEIDFDSESLIFVKPGLDTRPRFIIKPLNGTQIKNNQGTLELQVVRLDGTGSFDISGSSQGDAQLYSGDTLLNTSMAGIGDGGNGVTYNATLDNNAISGSLLISLKEDDGTVLDTITLLDVTDGLGGGTFLANSLHTNRGFDNSFTPATLPLTASFFDSNGDEYQKTALITPSYDGGIDKMKISSAVGSEYITLTANDGDGGSITLGDTNYTTTKDLTVNATFVDPNTNKTTTTTETFFIVSDGRDGQNSRSVRLTSNAQVFVQALDGTITPSEIEFTAIRQNISGSSTFNSNPSVTLTGTGDSRTLTNTAFGSNDSILLSVTGSENDIDYIDEVRIVRVKEGTDGLTLISSNPTHILPAESNGNVSDYANSGTTLSLFEGAEQLDYDRVGTDAGHWTVTTSQSPSSTITVGTIVDSEKDAVVPNHSAMNEDVDSVSITYTISGKRKNGEPISLTSVQTLTKSKEALDAVQVSNENSNHTVTARPNGVVGSSDLTNSGTVIRVFEGVNELYYTSGTPTDGEFTISATQSPSGVMNTPSISAEVPGEPSAKVADFTSMDTDEDRVIITYLIEGVRNTGQEFELTTTQTFTKAKEGIDGATGSPAVIVTPSISSQNISRTISTSPNTFDTVQPISFTVIQGNTTFSSISTSSTLSNEEYKVKLGSLINCTETSTGIITPTQPTVTEFQSGGVVSYTIQYKDINGIQNEIDFNHTVTVTSEGQTGPGIVHTGLWEFGKVYQFSSGPTGRRDSVLHNDVYYATTAQHTSTVTGTDGPPGFGSNWESLGEGDLFVAAKIGLFEDSYVQSTLNIGTNNEGRVSTANITLHGGSDNPYFSLGQTEQGVYGANGIFIGNDDGNYRASFVGGSNHLKWNGSTLDIKGDITISGEDEALDTNRITNQEDPMGGGTLNYNPDFTIVANDGRPSGVKAVWGSTNPNNISYLDTERTILKLHSSTDNTIGAGFPAIKVNPDSSYIIDFRLKSNVSSTNGLYFLMCEYNDELPSGITHISHIESGDIPGEPGVIDADQVADTSEYELSGTWYTNLNIIIPYESIDGEGSILFDGPITTEWVHYRVKYKTTQDDVKWVSPVLLNNVSMGTNELHVDRLSIIMDTSDKTQGTVGGWKITSDQIQGGNPSNGQDGAFTTRGMRLGSSGWISARQFYIDTSGNAKFSGTVEGGSIVGGDISVPSLENPNFSVDSDGNMSAQDANISGSFNIESGKLGSWVVDPIEIGGLLRDQSSQIRLDSINKEISISDIQEDGTFEKKVSINSKNLFLDVASEDVEIEIPAAEDRVNSYFNPTYDDYFFLDDTKITSNSDNRDWVYGPYTVGDLSPNVATLEASNITLRGLRYPRIMIIDWDFTVDESTRPYANSSYTGTDYSTAWSTAYPAEKSLDLYIEAVRISDGLVVRKHIYTVRLQGPYKYEFRRAGSYIVYGRDSQRYYYLNQPITTDSDDLLSLRQVFDTQLEIEDGGDYKFRYSYRLGVRSGYAQDVNDDGSKANPRYYQVQTKFSFGADILSQNSYMDITVLVQNNILELNSAGLQLVQNSSAYTRLNRLNNSDYDNAINTNRTPNSIGLVGGNITLYEGEFNSTSRSNTDTLAYLLKNNGPAYFRSISVLDTESSYGDNVSLPQTKGENVNRSGFNCSIIPAHLGNDDEVGFHIGNEYSFDGDGLAGTLSDDYDHLAWTSINGRTIQGASGYFFNINYVNVNAGSDRRLKNNISGSDLGLDFINNLNPVSYILNDDAEGKPRYGLIAQEVSESLASVGKHTDEFSGFKRDELYTSGSSESGSKVITKTKKEIENNRARWGSIDDWEYSDDTLKLGYMEFISPMIKAIQELSDKVTQLENQISGSNQ